MAFLRIDGWELPVSIEDFSYDDDTVQNYARTLNDSYQGVTYSRKDIITLSTTPLDLPTALSVAGWVRCTKHLWTFERPKTGTVEFSRFSSDGGALFSSGTSNATPLFGTWGLLLNPFGVSTATVSFGSEGDWTTHAYHRISAGSFVSYVTRSRNGVIDSWAGVSPSATNLQFEHTAASGFLSMQLKALSVGGSVATSQYSAISMARFAYSDDQIKAVANLDNVSFRGPTAAPYVVLTGDFLQRSGVPANVVGEPGPVVMKGFVDQFDLMPVALNGQFRYNARSLKIRLVQK